MFFIQYLIHTLGLVTGARYFKYTLTLLSMVFLALLYDTGSYKNFSTQEAMDAAQLGRNLSEGKGYTTLFIRPLSLHLIEETGRKKSGTAEAGKLSDYARIRQAHPDIANAPVYPVLLAGLMKVLPFQFTISTTKPFWSSNGRFWRYQPDFLIALFNEVLFAAMILVSFLWARRLFDRAVAWTSVALLLGAELLWRYCVSGLSTILLGLIFMGLVWCLTSLVVEIRERRRGPAIVFAMAAATGALIGLGGLTRYAFAWLMIPTLVFLILFTDSRRGIFCTIALAAFAAVMVPWILRNYNLSGAAFGTASFSVLETTGMFPEHRLARSLSPDIQFFMPPIWAKLSLNLRVILPALFENLGGGWITGFFTVGLLVGFRNPAIRRMRYFVLSCVGTLVIVQAFGRTQLSEDSPEINSENLTVVLLPAVVIYGVSFFYLLIDQVNFPVLRVRHFVVGAFGALACLPMIFALLPPATVPVAYPPYHPLVIQQTAAWMNDDELMMSDIPWAVAWYGHRQCVWLTLNATSEPGNPSSRESFLAIHDYLKTISGLYLTPKTLDSRFVSDWIRAGEHSWGSFIVDVILKSEVPPDFPLHEMPTGYLPEQLFLSDWKRWR